MCRRHYKREWSRTPKGRDSNANKKLLDRYGITLADKRERLKAQGGKCGACQKKIVRSETDHDGDNGKLRGELCGNCNRGLGLFFHNPTTLLRAIGYIQRWAREHAAKGL